MFRRFAQLSRSFSSTIKPSNPSNIPENVSETMIDISPISGTPATVKTNRKVYIYQAAKSTMTSGRSHINSAKSWKLEFDNAQERWENPLIGWISSRDTLNQLNLKFVTAEDAIRFAQKNGWDYIVREDTQETAWKTKTYSDNFKYSAGKLRYIPTK